MQAEDARLALAIGAWVHQRSDVPRKVVDRYRGKTYQDPTAQGSGSQFNFRTKSPDHLIKSDRVSRRYYVEFDGDTSSLLVEEQSSDTYKLSDLDNKYTYQAEVRSDRVTLRGHGSSYEFELS